MQRSPVSVVIPTAGLHRRGMLAACLAAVARSVEVAGATVGCDVDVVVVLDGGRCDDYADAVAGTGARLLAQPAAGPATARNRGWRATSGAVVAFLDDDTVPERPWFGALSAFFAAHPGVAGAGGPVLPLAPRNLVSRTLTDHGHLAHRAAPCGGALLLTANAAFRRETLEAVGGFDERFRRASGEDLDLCARVLAHGHRIGLVPGAVVAHHHPTTVRGMVVVAQRYGAPHAPDGPVATRRDIVQRRARFAVAAARNVRNVPAWYAVGRRSPHRPAPHVAVAEALLHVVWQAAYDTAPASSSCRVARTPDCIAPST